MTFFSDPQHIWIAVLVGSTVVPLAIAATAVVFTLVNQRILNAFLDDQRERDERAEKARREAEDSRHAWEEAEKEAWRTMMEFRRTMNDTTIPTIRKSIEDLTARVDSLERLPHPPR